MEKIISYDETISPELTERKNKYLNAILILSAITIMSVFFYGMRVLQLMAVAILVSFVSDYICVLFSGKFRFEKYDFSSVTHAMIITLLMPATVEVYALAAAVLVSSVVAKHPFGGADKAIFSPPAVGVAFSAICWSEQFMKLPVPFTTYSTTENAAVVQFSAGPSSILKLGGMPKIDYIDVLLGKFCGGMGTTCMLVLACCLLYLLSRKSIHGSVVLTTLAVVAVWAFCFPRIEGERVASLIFEMSSDAFVFGLMFLANEPSTTPKTRSGRMFFGVILGVLVIIFKIFGVVNPGIVYAILIADVFAIPCDKYALYITERVDSLVDKIKERTNSNEKPAGKVKGGEAND